MTDWECGVVGMLNERGEAGELKRAKMEDYLGEFRLIKQQVWQERAWSTTSA